jgi:hypothetical protein
MNLTRNLKIIFEEWIELKTLNFKKRAMHEEKIELAKCKSNKENQKSEITKQVRK